LLGIAPAVESNGFHRLVDWIARGFAGEMDYFAKRREAYRHPSSVLQGVKSLIALAYPYSAASPACLAPGQGRVARYVWSGEDYHDVIHAKLKRICDFLQDQQPATRARGVVDTAPLMEREIAQQAGLGWCGKNTLLLNQRQGSYFFLTCVLTDIVLPYDRPHETTHCGRCTACLDACPTQAFPQPGVLDASRCISYLTIEHRGPIAVELREGIGDWFFGCDVCQEVCPWNRKPARVAAMQPGQMDAIELHELFTMTDQQFRARFRRTPLWRSKRRGLLRNAAIVLGNQRRSESVESLIVGLNDGEPIVRGAAAWALGKIGSGDAMDALARRRLVESDTMVIPEIVAALKTG